MTTTTNTRISFRSKPYYLTRYTDGKRSARFEHGFIRFATGRAGALLEAVRKDIEETRRRAKQAQGRYKGEWRQAVEYRVRITQGGVTLLVSLKEAEKFARLLEEELAG